MQGGDKLAKAHTVDIVYNRVMAYPLSYTKARYREIFHTAKSALDNRLMALREGFACPVCDAPPERLLDTLHPGCGYRAWQARCVDVIEQEIGKEIYEELQRIEAEKKRTQCHMCGLCCRMASSEYSFEELLARATSGDEFARQFTSIFLPYASLEAAQARLPQVVAATLAEAGGPVHFYHCPYVGEDNRCSIFGSPKRPAICGQYPDTPLTFMVDECAWSSWKAANHPQTLLTHAMIELCRHYAACLRHAL